MAAFSTASNLISLGLTPKAILAAIDIDTATVEEKAVAEAAVAAAEAVFETAQNEKVVFSEKVESDW